MLQDPPESPVPALAEDLREPAESPWFRFAVLEAVFKNGSFALFKVEHRSTSQRSGWGRPIGLLILAVITAAAIFAAYHWGGTGAAIGTAIGLPGTLFSLGGFLAARRRQGSP